MDINTSKNNFLDKLKLIHQKFISAVDTAYKKHADKIKGIMKNIEIRKIEKLSAEIKSQKNG